MRGSDRFVCLSDRLVGGGKAYEWVGVVIPGSEGVVNDIRAL